MFLKDNWIFNLCSRTKRSDKSSVCGVVRCFGNGCLRKSSVRHEERFHNFNYSFVPYLSYSMVIHNRRIVLLISFLGDFTRSKVMDEKQKQAAKQSYFHNE